MNGTNSLYNKALQSLLSFDKLLCGRIFSIQARKITIYAINQEEPYMDHVRNFYLPLFALTVLVFALAACTTPQGNAEDGKRWYMMNNCYGCHGLHGNDGKAPKIDTNHMSFRRFLSIIRDSGSPIMQKFPEEKVSRQDAADMYAWLSTNT